MEKARPPHQEYFWFAAAMVKNGWNSPIKQARLSANRTVIPFPVCCCQLRRWLEQFFYK